MQTSPDSTPLFVLGTPASIWVGQGSHTIKNPMTLNVATTIETEGDG